MASINNYSLLSPMPHLPLCCCVVPSFCRYLCLFFSYESSTRTLENNNPWIFKIQDKRVRVCRKGQNLSPGGVVLYNCSGLVDMQMLKEGKEQILLLMWVIITSTFPIWGKHFIWTSFIWFIIKLAIYFILYRRFKTVQNVIFEKFMQLVGFFIKKNNPLILRNVFINPNHFKY